MDGQLLGLQCGLCQSQLDQGSAGLKQGIFNRTGLQAQLRFRLVGKTACREENPLLTLSGLQLLLIENIGHKGWPDNLAETTDEHCKDDISHQNPQQPRVAIGRQNVEEPQVDHEEPVDHPKGPGEQGDIFFVEARLYRFDDGKTRDCSDKSSIQHPKGVNADQFKTQSDHTDRRS
jgi:hypothetical protein